MLAKPAPYPRPYAAPFFGFFRPPLGFSVRGAVGRVVACNRGR